MKSFNLKQKQEGTGKGRSSMGAQKERRNENRDASMPGAGGKFVVRRNGTG